LGCQTCSKSSNAPARILRVVIHTKYSIDASLLRSFAPESADERFDKIRLHDRQLL
jgi:hypothetical protein